MLLCALAFELMQDVNYNWIEIEALKVAARQREHRDLRWRIFQAGVVITIVCSSLIVMTNRDNDSAEFFVERIRESLAKTIAMQSQLAAKYSKLAAELNELKTVLVNTEVLATAAARDTIPNLAEQLLADDGFRSAIVQAVSESPTEGFLREDDFRKEKAGIEEALAAVSGDIEKMLPVYDAIDVKNKETVLAIPMMRLAITEVSSDLRDLRSELEKSELALRTVISTETNRIYDLGKWFLGLLVVAFVFPLIEPLFKWRKPSEEAPLGKPKEEETTADKPPKPKSATAP